MISLLNGVFSAKPNEPSKRSNLIHNTYTMKNKYHVLFFSTYISDLTQRNMHLSNSNIQRRINFCIITIKLQLGCEK